MTKIKGIDINVTTHQKTQQGLKLIRCVWIMLQSNIVTTHQKTQQGLKLNGDTVVSVLLLSHNASENPTGIETWSMRITMNT